MVKPPKMEWGFFMKKAFSIFLILCCASACNFLKVKVSPDPFYHVALVQDSNNPAALFSQGMRFIHQGRYGDALKYFDRLTRIEPKNAIDWFYLGRCYYEVRQYGKSRSAFEKAGELQPSEAALLGLAAATLMDGDKAQAKQLLHNCEKQYGVSAALLQVWGDAAFLSGDASGAMKYYRQSLEKNPNQPEIQARLKDLVDYLTSAG